MTMTKLIETLKMMDVPTTWLDLSNPRIAV